MPLTDTKFELCRDIKHVLKIGREFQKQDNWRGAHHDTVKLLCDTIEYLYEQSNARAGNGMVMRYALESVRHDMWDLMGSSSESFREILAHRIRTTIRSALDTPPRYCDVMSLESAKKLWFIKEIIPRLDGDLPLGKEIPFDEWFVSLTIKEEGAK